MHFVGLFFSSIMKMRGPKNQNNDDDVYDDFYDDAVHFPEKNVLRFMFYSVLCLLQKIRADVCSIKTHNVRKT